MSIATRSVLPVLFLLVSALPAAAQVVCGDVIPAGANVVLTADLNCPSDDPALTVTGPANVDMAGFLVTCDYDGPDPNGPTGILLDAKGVKLSNGVVERCADNLVVAGTGGHKIENIVSRSASAHGILVNSDKNKLKNIAANDNVGEDGRGLMVLGNKNKFENITAYRNGSDGMFVAGDGNQVRRAVFARNQTDGLELSGDGNKAKDCFVTDNATEGIDIVGNGNKVEKSIITRAGDNDELDDPALEIEGDGNQVKNNFISDNIRVGILALPGASNTKISKNVVLGNPDFDLQDEAVGGTCGSNQWKGNTFSISSAEGNPSPACIE